MLPYNCFEDIMKVHNVDDTLMQELNEVALEFVKNVMQIPIHFCDSETLRNLCGSCYRINRKLLPNQVEAIDTCKANKVGIYMDIDIKKVGGICGRFFDIVHISGHISQWNDNPSYYEFGILDHKGDPDKKGEVLEYEKNAMDHSLRNLDDILNLYDQQNRSNIILLFKTLSIIDINYVLQLVEGNTGLGFFEKINDTKKIRHI